VTGVPTAGEWPSLGIVVPVYNESAGIDRGIRAIDAVAGRYPGRAVVIAVDDGSADDSAERLTALSEETDSLVVERHAENSGYGRAIVTGARRAHELGLEYVAFIDSDLTNPPEDLLEIGRLAAAGHRYIKGSRFKVGGNMKAVPWRRRVWSVTGNRVGSLLAGAGISDVTNGFRGVRTEDFLRWPLRERGFAVIVEELDLALRDGLEPVEFATVLTARTEDQRPSAFPYSPAMITSYLRYPLRTLARRLRESARRAG
jgi:glycosyltransferase involved in cell wall biosynthesis